MDFKEWDRAKCLQELFLSSSGRTHVSSRAAAPPAICTRAVCWARIVLLLPPSPPPGTSCCESFFTLPPVCVVGFSFKCVLQQIAWVRVEVSASIWHRFPLDFQRLAMVRSWLCYRLCVTPGLIAVLSFPAAGTGGCRVLAPSEGRKCSEATLHFRSSFKLWRYVWGHGHWLRPTCMWVILDCFKNQVV